MKRLKDPYTPLIAVSMMLVAVVALLFFATPVEYSPDEAELRAFLIGEWVAVSAPEMTSNELQSFTLTKAGQLVPPEGRRLGYTYDPQTKVVTVNGPEAFSTLKYDTRYDCAALISQDLRVYVPKDDYDRARAFYLDDLSVNAGQYVSFLGTWVPLMEKDTADPLYCGKSLTLSRDLRATFSGLESSIPFSGIGVSKRDIYLYPEGRRKDGINHLLTTYLGFSVLKGNGITYVRESDFADASTAHARLLATTGEWICWNKGAEDVFSSSKVNYFGQRFSLSSSMICTRESGKTSAFAFMPNTQSFVIQNSNARVLQYTEKYGFPMLVNGSEDSPFAYVRENDLEAAHQIYLQKVQEYILWREKYYQDCGKWLKMNQTEIGLNVPLRDSGKWSASVKEAIIQENTNTYTIRVSIGVTNLSADRLQLDKAIQETYLSMSTINPDFCEPEQAFEESRFLLDSVLDANGVAPETLQVAPGETVTLQWTYEQVKFDAYELDKTITDPILQDYFAHFVFGGTKYVIQLQEAFLTK